MRAASHRPDTCLHPTERSISIIFLLRRGGRPHMPLFRSSRRHSRSGTGWRNLHVTLAVAMVIWRAFSTAIRHAITSADPWGCLRAVGGSFSGLLCTFAPPLPHSIPRRHFVMQSKQRSGTSRLTGRAVSDEGSAGGRGSSHPASRKTSTTEFRFGERPMTLP